MKLSLGFSPCPNDTFIFDALIHDKIDTEGLEFEVFYDDVETLNQKAFKQELAITKLSYHAYAYVTNTYVLLNAGSALGFGVGPLLVSNELSDLSGEDRNTQHAIRNTHTVGIPGKYTTANFLLSLAFPQLTNKKEMLFSEIEDKLIKKEIDFGLIIHENRFTYQDKGLVKIMDLGEYWEKETGCAIPLGGIVVKRQLPNEVKNKLNRVLRKSVEFAFTNPKSGLDFIKSHAQEMSEEVMYKHIDLYVNNYSIDLGEEGKRAITKLYSKAKELNVIPDIAHNIFVS